MAVHELTTNAVKYGALSVPDGRLAVGWKTEEIASPSKLATVDAQVSAESKPTS